MSAQRPVRGCPAPDLPGQRLPLEPGHPGSAQAHGPAAGRRDLGALGGCEARRRRHQRGPDDQAKRPAPAQASCPPPPPGAHKSRAVFSHTVRLRRRVSQK